MRKLSLLVLMAFLLPWLNAGAQATFNNRAISVPARTSAYGGTVPRLEVNEHVVIDRTDGSEHTFTNPLTMMAWYNLQTITNVGNNRGNILLGHVARVHCNYNGSFYMYINTSGEVSAKIAKDGYDSSLGVAMPSGEWHNLAMAYDPDALTVTYYMDGEQIGQRTLEKGAIQLFADNPCVFQFAGFGAGCYVDDAAIYNKTLTAEEIKTAMNDATALSPVCYYDFEESTATGQYPNLGSSDVAAEYLTLNGTASSDGGVISSRSFTATEPTYVEGREKEQQVETHTLTLTTAGEGDVTISDGENTYASGDAIPANADLTLTFAPAEGWTLASAVFADGDFAGMDLVALEQVENGTFQLGNLTTDLTLNVTFEEIPTEVEYCTFDESVKSTHAERYTEKITVKINDGAPVDYEGLQTTTGQKIYWDKTETVITAAAGDELTVTLGFHGSWMHSAVMVDYDKDGEFLFDVNETFVPSAQSEVVAFTGVVNAAGNHYDSNGTALDANSRGDRAARPMTFTIPADLAPGDYRFRATVDWNKPTVLGCPLTSGGNAITGNGGIVADFTLRVEEAAPEITHTLSINKTGEGTVTIKDADNNEYESGAEVPESADLTLTFAPAEGWTLASAVLGEGDYAGVDLVANDMLENGQWTLGNLTLDQTINVTFEKIPTEAEYTAPSGDGGSGSNCYVETASTTGATENISISRTQKNASNWELCDDQTIVTEPGQTFTLRMQAKNVGDNGTTETQDLRFCMAYIFADWNGDGEFEAVAPSDETWTAKGRIGCYKTEFTEFGTTNSICNRDFVLDFSQDFTVPADAKLGNTRIRIIYTEAWDAVGQGGPISGNYQSINKGYSYDYLVTVKEAAPKPVELEGDVISASALFASMDSPSVNSNNEFSGFSGTEGKATYKGAIGLYKSGDANYFKFDQNGRPYITSQNSNGKVKKVYVRWAPDADESAAVNVLGLAEELQSANSLPIAGATAKLTKTGEIDSYEFTEDFAHVAVYLAGPTAYVSEISVVWEPDAAGETYAVVIDDVENGSLAVMNGEEAVTTGAKLAAGTVLTLTATPATGYEATAITANNNNIEDLTIVDGVATATFTMGEEAAFFSAQFAEIQGPKPPVVSKENYAIRIPNVSNNVAYRLEVDESAVLDRATADKVGDWPIFSNSFTMMGWYKLVAYTNNSYNNKGNVLMGHQPRCHVNYNGAFVVNVNTQGKLGMGGKFKTESAEIEHSKNFTSDVVIPLDEWVNIAAVYNADDMNIKVYVNGELAGTRALGAKLTSFPDNPGVLTFGSTNANCWVDEAVLFNSALSDQEILTAMESASTMSPACFYTFTETNGTDGEYANEGSLEYPAKLIKATGNGSSDGGIISASSFVSVAAESGEGRELPNVEYCTYPEDVVSTGLSSRRTATVYVNAGSYPQVTAGELQTAGKQKIYWDKSDVIVTTNPDDSITVQMDYKSMNMHSVVFIDFNRDGEFTPVLDENSKPTAASEAVAFSALKLEGGLVKNSDGVAVTGSTLAQKAMKFALPAGIKPGDYRMRAMVTWNEGELSACPELDYDASSSILKGGIMVDMTLRVTALAKRTITVASSDEALGTATITSPATEGNSVNTSEGVVIKATATDPDAYFVNWTDESGEVVTTEEEYTYGGKADASFTANFRQHYAITVVDEEDGTTVKHGNNVIASGDLVDKGTELTVVCEVSGKWLTSLMINDEEKVDEYTQTGYKFTVNGATVIKPVFELPSYEVSALAVEGEGTLVVAEDVTAEGAPAGATFAEQAELEEGSEPYVIATPAKNNQIETFIVNGVAVMTAGKLTDDANELEFITTYAEGLIVAYHAYVDRDINASVKFVSNGSAIESIDADEAGDAEFFNLQGIRVARENLVPGIYIMRNAEGARKVSVK